MNALLHLCEVVGAKAWPRRFQPQTLKHCNKHGETVLNFFPLLSYLWLSSLQLTGFITDLFVSVQSADLGWPVGLKRPRSCKPELKEIRFVD